MEKMNVTKLWARAHKCLVSNAKHKKRQKRGAAKAVRRNAKHSLFRYGELRPGYRPDSRDVV